MPGGVPEIYLINLDRSTDRMQRFQQINGHLGDVRRFSAVDGSTLDRQALIAAGTITEDLAYKAGTLGSALSHIRRWELAAREYRSITVCEDAIVVSHGFLEQATRILASLQPDWDIVQWGYNFAPAYLWVDLGVSQARISGFGARRFSRPDTVTEFQTLDLVPSAVRLVHSFGIQAYSISGKGARAVLQLCLPLRSRMIEFPEAAVRTPDVAIDVTLSGIYPALAAYVCLPQLVIRDAVASVRRNIDAA